MSIDTGEPAFSALNSEKHGAHHRKFDVGHFLKSPSPTANLVGYDRKDKPLHQLLKAGNSLVPGFFLFDNALRPREPMKQSQLDRLRCIYISRLSFFDLILIHLGAKHGSWLLPGFAHFLFAVSNIDTIFRV